MDRKKLMLLVVALVIAVGTALGARTLFAGASAPQAAAAVQAPKGPKVLVAQRALPVGTIITADSIAYQSWPKDMVQDAYFIDGEADMSKLLGTVVRYPITAGQPVTQGALVAPGDRGFLAAALGPGMRAITIPVSAKTGVAGFVFPGDHIDLVLTQQVKGMGDQPLKASETILKNLRVLATDQSTTTETVDGKSVVRTSSTVTLEVTPRIAEKVAVAETIGQLSLSLRSLADNQSELDRMVAAGTVKVPDGASKEQEDKILSQAMNRPIDGPTTYVTGGDVSRFQRNTMPPSREQMMAQMAQHAGHPQLTNASETTVPTGPVVRVTRGKNTTVVTVGRD
jgi:pilus assembly protein CpaB